MYVFYMQKIMHATYIKKVLWIFQKLSNVVRLKFYKIWLLNVMLTYVILCLNMVYCNCLNMAVVVYITKIIWRTPASVTSRY